MLQWEAAVSFFLPLTSNDEKRNCTTGSLLLLLQQPHETKFKTSRNLMTGWKCEAKDTFSRKSYVCQIRQRSLNSVRDSSFTSPFYFFHFFLGDPPLFLYCLRDFDWTEQAFRGRVKEEEQAWLDGQWTKCALDRKVTGNKRSLESWDRGIAKAWEQPRCFTDMSGQTFKATR